MSRSSQRQAARSERQKQRSYIIDRDFKDIKAKFPSAIKAWITFGGNLSDRMKEEARGDLPTGRRQLRTMLKQRREGIELQKSKIHFEKMRKEFADKKEQSKKNSVIHKLFRRGVA